MQALFNDDVVDILCPKPDPEKKKKKQENADGEKGSTESFLDIGTGLPIDDLYPLPSPADQPVIFSVRISMAFPGLFTAVRLYQRVASPDYLPTVRDEFGAVLLTPNREPVTYPAADGQRSSWVQELWLSDGGIASNFPIHFFDAVLPRWPTVGINLGSYPPGFGHQDVFLPTDRMAEHGVPAPMTDSFLSFLGAVFDTARNWRDTAQTFMPATRGRIAWVRQSSHEGGANLFMPRTLVATLALRGAVAGARLRRRFANDGQWRRHQWLRMRVGLDNLAQVQRRVAGALLEDHYAALRRSPQHAAKAMQDTFDQLDRSADPTPAGPNPFLSQPTPEGEAFGAERPFNWYAPAVADQPQFWEAAQRLLTSYNGASDPAGVVRLLNDQLPTPAAELRQVPSP